LPLARISHQSGLSPNIITGVGLSFAILSGISLAYHKLFIALVMFGVSIFCDMLDGAIARAFDLETSFGLFWDSFADRGSELAIVLGALAGGIVSSLAILEIFGSISLLAMRLVSYRSGFYSDGAYFGRGERVILLSIGLITPWKTFSTICFALAGFLSLISAFQIGFGLKGKDIRLFKTKEKEGF